MPSYIKGIGYYIPERVITSEEIERKTGIPLGIIEKKTGIRERRYVKKGILPSDTATFAAKEALKDAGLSANDIDVVIQTATSHDVPEPATSNIIQHKLGAKNAYAFDLKNACAGFVNAIFLADIMISQKKAKNILIVSGEVISPYIDFKIKSIEELEYKLAGLTLGDGGGALIISETKDKKRGILHTESLTIGEYWELAVVWAGGSKYPRRADLMYFYSKAREINLLAIKVVPDIILKVLKKTGWEPKDVDIVFAHQASVKTIKKIAEKVNIPFERCYITAHKFGNTASASIPMGIADAYKKGILKRGDKVLIVAGASGFSASVMSVIF